MIYDLRYTIYDLSPMYKYLKSKLVIQPATCYPEPVTRNPDNLC